MGQLPVVSMLWYMVKYLAYVCTQQFQMLRVCVQSLLKEAKQVLGWDRRSRRMPKAPVPAPAGGAEALAVPWLALGYGTITGSEDLSESKRTGLFLSPALPRQAELSPRVALEGCTACQDADRGRREVFSGGAMWGWLSSVGTMLHTAAGENKPGLCCFAVTLR